MLVFFGWIVTRQEKLFDKIEAIGNRLNKIEEKIVGVETRLGHLEGMLQTIVGFLLGNKTGT
jgi:hypothetical protein